MDTKIQRKWKENKKHICTNYVIKHACHNLHESKTFFWCKIIYIFVLFKLDINNLSYYLVEYFDDFQKEFILIILMAELSSACFVGFVKLCLAVFNYMGSNLSSLIIIYSSLHQKITHYFHFTCLYLYHCPCYYYSLCLHYLVLQIQSHLWTQFV